MKLADIVDVFIAGDWGNESLSNDTPNAVFCIRGADIMSIRDHKYTDIPKRYISKRAKETKLLKVGDLVIEKSGGSPIQSTGRITYISEDLIQAKKELVCSNFSIGIRVKSRWNPLYVYYYWQYIYNLGVFFNFESKTSGIKNLQLDSALEAIAIEEIPLEVQNQIVATLSSYDHKIAFNRAINHNLVAMAKQLYDYWFVQFDFPNRDGKPYKSSGGKMVWNEKLKREIPEGWEVKELNEIIKVKDGTHTSPKPQNEGYYLITSKHISENGIDFNSAYRISIEDYTEINRRSLVESRDILFSMIGTIGQKYLVTERTINYAIKNMALLKTSQYTEIVYYIWLYLSSIDYIRYESNVISGSIQKFMSLDAMRKIPILYNLEKILSFQKIVTNLFLQISITNSENKILTKQRDELLPLLMNGQVTVG